MTTKEINAVLDTLATKKAKELFGKPYYQLAQSQMKFVMWEVASDLASENQKLKDYINTHILSQ